jgi:Uma2 family endonuclease
VLPGLAWHTGGDMRESSVTALPHPGRLLTIAEYAALGEDDHHRWELREGSLLGSPSPTPRHMIALAELVVQLNGQLPAELVVVLDVDIDLELVPADQPGSSRRPDLVVVGWDAVKRVDRDGGMLRASEVLLVVEIVSPGSRRLDHLTKRGEYADAGIPHYWIVDLDAPVSLLDCHLAGGFGYQDDGGVTGVVAVSVPFPGPFPVRLDLDRLA